MGLSSILSKMTSPYFEEAPVQNNRVLEYINGESIDGETIHEGAINGHSPWPVGTQPFCTFQILSGRDVTLKWQGFNVKEATCVYQEDLDEDLVTITYNRRPSFPEDLLCFSADPIHRLTFTENGVSYLTPHRLTASSLLLVYLSEDR